MLGIGLGLYSSLFRRAFLSSFVPAALMSKVLGQVRANISLYCSIQFYFSGMQTQFHECCGTIMLVNSPRLVVWLMLSSTLEATQSDKTKGKPVKLTNGPSFETADRQAQGKPLLRAV